MRLQAIHNHGFICKVCGFDFEKKYGSHGKNYIEVHHLIPLRSLNEPTKVNSFRDMTVVCSNCHRMIHRNPNNVLSIEQLKKIIRDG